MTPPRDVVIDGADELTPHCVDHRPRRIVGDDRGVRRPLQSGGGHLVHYKGGGG